MQRVNVNRIAGTVKQEFKEDKKGRALTRPLMVRSTRLELVWVFPHAPQTCASASSATIASHACLRVPRNYKTIRNDLSSTIFCFFPSQHASAGDRLI